MRVYWFSKEFFERYSFILGNLFCFVFRKEITPHNFAISKETVKTVTDLNNEQKYASLQFIYETFITIKTPKIPIIHCNLTTKNRLTTQKIINKKVRNVIFCIIGRSNSHILRIVRFFSFFCSFFSICVRTHSKLHIQIMHVKIYTWI